jgi:hypothetical protein
MNRRLFFWLVTTLIFSWIAVSLPAEEIGEHSTQPPAPDAQTSPTKRWYTNLDEARRVANDLGRPIMIVFR